MARFTPGSSGFYWRMMPSKTSAIWDSMTMNLRNMSNRGIGTRGYHSVVSIDPSSMNSKNIDWLLNFDKVNTSIETRAALKEVGSFVAHEVNARYFEQEGLTPGGWEALKETTLRWRAFKRYSDGPILQASGELYDAATSNMAIDDIEMGRNPRVIMGGANWGGELMEKYFVHMAGGWSQLYKAPIPPRPFMPQSEGDFTDSEERHMKQIFQRHIENLFERV
jgi:phage gpG-like protein